MALDTSWDQNVLSTGAVAVLQDPQAGYVAARSGFAVIDLAADTISVRYRDDDGRQVHRETVS